ncbi:MAG: stage sporulation protein [Clostridia bacterium]|nr:stage sporulation protein [Clostridia bacterium]
MLQGHFRKKYENAGGYWRKATLGEPCEPLARPSPEAGPRTEKAYGRPLRQTGGRIGREPHRRARGSHTARRRARLEPSPAPRHREYFGSIITSNGVKKMMVVTNRMRVLLALLLTFGVLVYLVQGERRALSPAGIEQPAEGPGDKINTGAKTTPAAAPIVQEPRAEDILKGAQSKAGSKSGSAFFVEYRLERDRNRSKQIQLLKEIIDSPSAPGEGKQEAQKRLVDLTQQMDLELQLEKLIVAKGYQEAAVFIQPHAVNVLVMAANFGPGDANKIGDLVCRATGRPREQVSIIPFS